MLRRAILVAMALAVSAGAAHAASLAERIATRPGEIVDVPPGLHTIDGPLILRADGSGLVGLGTIVQTDPSAPIVRVDGAQRSEPTAAHLPVFSGNILTPGLHGISNAQISE